MQTPTITKSQRQIIFYLYKFRFLLIDQLQQLFNHKDPHRIKEWLKDLETKKYINIIKDPKNKTKPYIICLAQRSRHILKDDKDVNKIFLDWLYQEKVKSEVFIQRELFVVDCYLYFLKNKEEKSVIDFFTKQDLKGYEYFPDPLPDCYIDVKDGKTHSRYFLDYFDNTALPGNLRFRVRYYFKYLEEGSWQINTDNAVFPTILFVLETERKKKHIFYYSKSLIEKSLNTDIEIFLTTKDKIKFNKGNTDIWESVGNDK